jgi:membrane glycosyltransferase
MRHCALAPIPGRGGLAGEILSHDFVEAALMRRAGYEVWLVDLPGSYEQQPPHLIEELTRDRRWCQGNLQNARLIAEPGFKPVHRAMLATGAMSYLASPLWLAFVVLGTVRWFSGDGGALPAAAPWLWLATLAMLFGPRVLGVLIVLRDGEQREFGGRWRLAAGAVLEAVLATLQAPVRMIAHSMFVLGALTGIRLDWKSPSRDAASVGWGEALLRFGNVGALVAMALAIAAARGAEAVALRLSPLALPLLLAIPLAVLTSRVALGDWLKRHRLLLIPEEARTPPLLQRGWSAVPAPVVQTLPRRRPAAMRAVARASWAFARAAAVAAIVAVPVASAPGPDRMEVAFSYLVATPAPWEMPAVMQASLPPVEDITKVSTGAKRKPAKRAGTSAI